MGTQDKFLPSESGRLLVRFSFIEADRQSHDRPGTARRRYPRVASMRITRLHRGLEWKCPPGDEPGPVLALCAQQKPNAALELRVRRVAPRHMQRIQRLPRRVSIAL